MPVLLLIHEASLFLTFPLMALTLSFDCFEKNHKKRIFFVLSLILILLGITYFISNFHLDNQQVETFIGQHKGIVDFNISQSLRMIYTMSGSDNFFFMIEFWQRAATQYNFIYTIGIVLPSLLLFFYCYLQLLRTGDFWRSKFILCCIATFAPILLSIFGFDYSRWVSYSLLLCCIWLYHLTSIAEHKTNNPQINKFFIKITLLVIAMNLFLGTEFMGYCKFRNFVEVFNVNFSLTSPRCLL